ncbi:glycerophosphodiester phosphodiesterase GDPD4 isoform X2 [Cryptomeria japonica]|uniref:glycerophosphodiester phosphodiesterase GDPD4 isoform X2 n=1 Tax=Cryptomeria japonica TaxID=3369 RepID=UPI0027DA0E2F|nr:glycerophosphodiester phosphodiesterase GDPD4 isoform X2 [Cryptomeria japonica]
MERRRKGLMAKPSALSSFKISRKNIRFSFRSFVLLFFFLAILAFVPPIFLHLRLKRHAQIQRQKCGWLQNPPLVCAHGGDSSRAPANTMAAYRLAVHSQVDCMEIDASRSHDGVLMAIHDRDLQNMSGDNSAKVGNLNLSQIKRLDAGFGFSKEFQHQEVPTLDDALKFVSDAVKQVIVDAKVGPPRFEEGLAADLLLTMNKIQCRNCIIWAKTDSLVRELKKLSHDVVVGYIVMKDPITGMQSDLLRMERADVIGVYHVLVNENLVGKAHRRHDL